MNTILEETLKSFMKEVGKEFVKKAAVVSAEEGAKTCFFYVKKRIEQHFEQPDEE